MTKLVDGSRVVDVDTHMTEPHDLFVSRAPKGYEDRVPRVEVVDGRPMWLIDGKPTAGAHGGGAIGRNGKKFPAVESHLVWTIDDVHPATYDPGARLELMDDFGIDTQVVFPNAIGIGGQQLSNATVDPMLRRICVEIYNDAMAEVQDASNRRLIPMPVMPAWSVEDCVREARRAASLDLRGVAMTSDPQETGSPDLASQAWDPLWEVCSELRLPVHFHIGSSQTAASYFWNYSWESQHHYLKAAVGSVLVFLSNARVLVNAIFAGIFDRFPDLTMVSVESGAGWIPFILEAMDHELWQAAPVQAEQLAKMPSEYFKDNWYATFWFEGSRGNLQALIDAIGDDKVMFETDYPHNTCLYPNPLMEVESKLSELRPDTRRKVMGENAASLYRL
jgi:predicted TIM-barrel fold metal-dependent hydrolase